jgi:DNA-binding NarL/FixJ family response regulator
MIQSLEGGGTVSETMRRINAMFERAAARGYIIDAGVTAGSFKAQGYRPERTLSDIRQSRLKVLELHAKGVRPVDICLQTGISQSSVYGMLARVKTARAGK